jgi:hypothetical protein
MASGHPPEDILKMNPWMKSYAKQVQAAYIDYFSALVDDKGWMAPIVSAPIETVLR